MKVAFLLITLFSFNALYAEPVCPKCEVIREYNKTHAGDYEYYEDYLKAEKQNQNKNGNKEQK